MKEGSLPSRLPEGAGLAGFLRKIGEIAAEVTEILSEIAAIPIGIGSDPNWNCPDPDLDRSDPA